MDTITGYKDRAIASLSGKWGKGAVAMVIFLAIEYLGSISLTLLLGTDSIAASLLSYAWTILCLPLGWGVSIFFLDIAQGQNPEYGQLFDGFKDFVRIVCTYILYAIIVIIGFLLFVVPGIIATLMFSQISYILKENPTLSITDTLRLSAAMMKGHKMDLFLLGLSFIGWILLSVLTLGLGFLLLYPYMYTAFGHFYEDLKEEYTRE